MKNIETQGNVTVASGCVALTHEQAKPRLYALEAVKVKGKTDLSGVYRIVQPIQFKAGEKFGFDGEIAKDGRMYDPEQEARARAKVEDDLEAAIQTAKAAGEAAGKLAGEAAERARLADAVAAALAPIVSTLNAETQTQIDAALGAVFGK